MTCPLCDTDGGLLIARLPRCRVVRVQGAEAADFPVFYRVIWNAHVAEWSDLTPEDQAECMRVLTTVERVVRQHCAPTKINLAALGNVVPHLHWHVIGRLEGDSRWPAPVWAAAQRGVPADFWRLARAALPVCDAAMAQALGAAPTSFA